MARYPVTTSIWRRYLAIGVVVGVGVYMTSAVVFLPLFIGIADSVVNGIRRSMAPILLSMVIVSIFLTPWAVRNFIEYDRFIPLRGSAIFENVWAGWGEYRDNPFGAILSDSKTFEQAQEEGFEGDYGTPEFDAFMRGKVIDAIKTDPIWIAGAIVRRAENLALPNLDLGVAMYPSQR